MGRPGSGSPTWASTYWLGTAHFNDTLRARSARQVSHPTVNDIIRAHGLLPTERAEGCSAGSVTGYSLGMTTKIAVSLPDHQVAGIRRAVEQGRAASVSGYISAALARTEREDSLAALLADLDHELGPVDAADLAWADNALGLA